jgi:hypothetical protein
MNLDDAVTLFEQRLIVEALRVTNGNHEAAAKLLRIRTTALLAKLDRSGPEVCRRLPKAYEPYQEMMLQVPSGSCFAAVVIISSANSFVPARCFSADTGL